MADNERDLMAETPKQRRQNTSDDQNTDPPVDRKDRTPRPNRESDAAVKGEGPTDPDSAESENDRDDMVDE